MAVTKPKGAEAAPEAPSAVPPGEEPTNLTEVLGASGVTTTFLDQWCEELSRRIWTQAITPDSKPRASLFDRLLAITHEMGKLQRDADFSGGNRGTYKYYSVHQIESTINRLSLKYRVRFDKRFTFPTEVSGGVRLVGEFKAFCEDTKEECLWEYVDDGQDYTKAGAYVIKYGFMRFFDVGDSEDPDSKEDRGKPSTATATTRGGGNGATGQRSSGVDTTAITGHQLALLETYAGDLPEKAMWATLLEDGRNKKIAAMLQSKVKPDAILAQLTKAHEQFCKDCPHIEPMKKAWAEASGTPTPAAQRTEASGAPDPGEDPSGGYPG